MDRARDRSSSSIAMATTDETLVEDDPVDSGEEDGGDEPPAAATGTAQQLCVDSQLARTQSQQAQLQQLKAAAEAGEVLSKNAQKRLIKLQSKAERRGRAKAERKMRRQVRSARVDVAGSSVAGSSVVGPPQEMAEAIVHGEEHHAAAWAFWRRIGSPRTVLAPMVNQSELAFRMVARHYGAKLCFTPMLHSTLFASSEAYRLDNFDACSQERPLVTQFCGDDPATLLAAASLAQGECDAIDLNCGCPQAIARRGHYGAFLLEEPDLIVRIVAALAAPGALRVPVLVTSTHLTHPHPCLPLPPSPSTLPPPSTSSYPFTFTLISPSPLTLIFTSPSPPPQPYQVLVKMRLLPSLEQTVALAVRLQAAGASVITLHGELASPSPPAPTPAFSLSPSLPPSARTEHPDPRPKPPRRVACVQGARASRNAASSARGSRSAPSRRRSPSPSSQTAGSSGPRTSSAALPPRGAMR